MGDGARTRRSAAQPHGSIKVRQGAVQRRKTSLNGSLQKSCASLEKTALLAIYAIELVASLV